MIFSTEAVGHNMTLYQPIADGQTQVNTKILCGAHGA